MFHSFLVAGVSLLVVFPCHNRGMSPYHYLKARDRLSDPKGSLSQAVSSAAIASVNREMQRVMVVMHLPIAYHELAGAWSTPKVGSCGGPECKKHFSSGRPYILNIVQETGWHLKSVLTW